MVLSRRHLIVKYDTIQLQSICIPGSAYVLELRVLSLYNALYYATLLSVRILDSHSNINVPH